MKRRYPGLPLIGVLSLFLGTGYICSTDKTEDTGVSGGVPDSATGGDASSTVGTESGDKAPETFFTHSWSIDPPLEGDTFHVYLQLLLPDSDQAFELGEDAEQPLSLGRTGELEFSELNDFEDFVEALQSDEEKLLYIVTTDEAFHGTHTDQILEFEDFSGEEGDTAAPPRINSMTLNVTLSSGADSGAAAR